MRVCDRYLVISRGRIVDELPDSATANELMQSSPAMDVSMEGVS